MGIPKTTLLLSLAIAAGGCKNKPPPSEEDASVASSAKDAAPAPAKSKEKASSKPAMTIEGLKASSTAQMAAAMLLAETKDPDCPKIVDAMGASLYVAPPEVTAKNRAAVATIGVCLRKQRRWRDLEQMATLLGDDDPASPTAGLLPRAKIGVGDYVTANTALSALIKQWPREGEVYATGALAACRLEDWDECGKRADQALAFQRKNNPANTDEVSLDARLLRAQAYFFSGEIEKSTRELDALAKIKPSDALTALKARNQATKTHRLWIETEALESLFLGVLPLYGKSAALGPTATFKIYNFSNHPFSLTLEASVPGICDPATKTVVVTSKREVVKISPTPRADFDAAKAPKGVELAYKVKDTKDATVYFADARALATLPPGALPLMVTTKDGDLRKTRELSAAWITPAAKEVVALRDAAMKRVPGGTFQGKSGATFAQVQALWDEMRTREFSFARDAALEGATGVVDTRLPGDTIAVAGGSYLEGVLVFASLMESIGLDPILVFLPGHAMVGWLPSPGDKGGPHQAKIVSSPVGSGFFLEATHVREQPLEAAVLLGAAELVEQTGGSAFSGGRAAAYVLSKLRAKGITPRRTE